MNFQATTDQISHITSVLTAISSVNTQCSVYITNDGLTFITENHHTIRVSASFDKELFENYQFTNENSGSENSGSNESNDTELSSDKFIVSKSIKINVDLTKIVESFNLASSLTKLNNEVPITIKCTISYNGTGNPFTIEFKDSVMTEICNFATFVDTDNDTNNLQLDYSSLIMEVSLPSDILNDTLINLKDMNVEELYIFAGNKLTNQTTLDNKRLESNQLIFISKGDMGYSRFIFPDLDSLILKKFDSIDYEFKTIKNDYLLSVYKFEIFKKIIKAIKLCDKITIKKDNKGLLCIYMLSKIDEKLINNKKSYPGTIIEFSLLELVVDVEDDDFDKQEIEELINFKKEVVKKKKKKKTVEVDSNNDIINILNKKGIINTKNNIDNIFHQIDNDSYNDELFF